MQFLRRNLREAHPGIITRVRDFGLTIQLQDCFVEGLVRKEDMQDDWYEYVEERHLIQGRKRGRCFQLGDKVEVRVMFVWPDDSAEPIAVNLLTRLSKGAMMGVNFNKNKNWVGSSCAFFKGTSRCD